MGYGRLLTMLSLPSIAAAQTETVPPRTIHVTGTGKVSTMPTIALIDYWITGEGTTSDDASRALAERQKAIGAGIGGLLGDAAPVTSSNLSIIAVRGAQCDDRRGYNPAPKLSDGPCAIAGYVATLQGSIRTSAVAKAGTAAGLAGRLGARDARVQGYALADSGPAIRAATGAAIAEAKRLAAALADAAGEKLGPILTISDQNSRPYEDIVVTAVRAPVPSPPPPPPPPPVEIDMKPRPIETQVQVYVTFGIGS